MQADVEVVLMYRILDAGYPETTKYHLPNYRIIGPLRNEVEQRDYKPREAMVCDGGL